MVLQTAGTNDGLPSPGPSGPLDRPCRPVLAPDRPPLLVQTACLFAPAEHFVCQWKRVRRLPPSWSSVIPSVLIIGASKGIGLETSRQALKAGYRVRGLARSAARIALSDANLEKVRGDALNRQDLEAALRGMDVVIQALGVRVADMLRPIHLFSDATRILVSAMEGQGVKRLICVTGFGAGDSRASISCLQRVPFRLLLGRAYDDKSLQERIIKESSLHWTIVRPGVLTNGGRTGRYKVLVESSQWRNGIISRADVADFLVRQIEDRAYVGKAPVLVY
jgi:putative NADH-flavin reductase